MGEAVNVERGEVALGDFTLRLTMDKLCRAERLCDIRMPILFENRVKHGALTFYEAAVLIFIGRIDPPADWSLSAAMALIPALSFGVCSVAVDAALMLAFPEPDAPGEAKPLEMSQVSTG